MVECQCKELKEMQNENECLRKEYENLKEQSFRDKDNLEKLGNAFAKLNKENEKLVDEIQRLEGKCGSNCSQKQDFENGANLESLVRELQEQHQQDCIRINDLTTTISVLSSMYTNLRKNAGD